MTSSYRKHRKVSWVEVIFEAGGVIPLSLASFALGAVTPLSDATPLALLDLVGGSTFIFGTYVNLWQVRCYDHPARIYRAEGTADVETMF